MPLKRPWKVEFYCNPDGKQPVFDYIFSSGLSDKDIAILSNVLVSLQNLGSEIQGTKIGLQNIYARILKSKQNDSDT